MKYEFDVKMTTSAMYDYMMYHTMTGMQFYLAVGIGVMAIAAFVIDHNPLYLIAGLVMLLYLPCERYIQAGRQVKLNPVFKENLHYTLDDEKMSIDVKEEHMEAPWDTVTKVRSTRKSLILYTGSVTATIFPRESLGSDYAGVVSLIKDRVPAGRVRIKG
ncbi:MAG: YcxB family protein [Lachnospiraceae bacterium]|nr:YcxB family protein [Lachnospiraceae bacterium]